MTYPKHSVSVVLEGEHTGDPIVAEVWVSNWKPMQRDYRTSSGWVQGEDATVEEFTAVVRETRKELSKGLVTLYNDLLWTTADKSFQLLKEQAERE